MCSFRTHRLCYWIWYVRFVVLHPLTHSFTLILNLETFCVSPGGTLAGLGIGAHAAQLMSDRTGKRVTVTGFAVCDSAQIFLHHVDQELKQLWPSSALSASDIVTVNQDFKGIGYGKNTADEMEILLRLAHTTGIFLDNVYTLKAVIGMLKTFSTDRTLFVHTGGCFGLFNKQTLDVFNQVIHLP